MTNESKGRALELVDMNSKSNFGTFWKHFHVIEKELKVNFNDSHKLVLQLYPDNVNAHGLNGKLLHLRESSIEFPFQDLLDCRIGIEDGVCDEV